MNDCSITSLLAESTFAIANRQLEPLQVLLQEAALFAVLLAVLLAVARVYRACVAASGQLPELRWLQLSCAAASGQLPELRWLQLSCAAASGQLPTLPVKFRGGRCQSNSANLLCATLG